MSTIKDIIKYVELWRENNSISDNLLEERADLIETATKKYI